MVGQYRQKSANVIKVMAPNVVHQLSDLFQVTSCNVAAVLKSALQHNGFFNWVWGLYGLYQIPIQIQLAVKINYNLQDIKVRQSLI